MEEAYKRLSKIWGKVILASEKTSDYDSVYAENCMIFTKDFQNLRLHKLRSNQCIMVLQFMEECAVNKEFCSLNELYRLTENISEPIRVGTIRMAKEAQKEKYGVDVATDDDFPSVTKSTDIVSFEGLMLSSLQSIFDAGYSIKKCERCGRYFIPYKRYDTKYCDRRWPREKNKSCGELIRTEQAAIRRGQFDECKKAYRSIRNSLNNSRGNRENKEYSGKTAEQWWNEFEKEIPEKLYLTQRGEYPREQFMIDLDKYRRRAKRK